MFQKNAFQNNAFQTDPVPYIPPTGDERLGTATFPAPPFFSIFVLDPHDDVLCVLSNSSSSACPLWDDSHVEDLHGVSTYSFTAPANRSESAFLIPENQILLRDFQGRKHLFRIKTVDEQQDDGKRIKKVVSENSALELVSSIVRGSTWTGQPIKTILDQLLLGTRWRTGEVDWSGILDYSPTDFPSVLKAVKEVAEKAELEIEFRVEWDSGEVKGRYIDFVERRGEETHKRFVYGKDIKGLTRTGDTSELYTAMIGIGKADDKGVPATFKDVVWSKGSGNPADKPAGQDWVGDDEALQRWGLRYGDSLLHLFGVFQDPDETSATKLLQKTWAELQKKKYPAYSYEIAAVLLDRAGPRFVGDDEMPFDHEKLNLGDTVVVIDESFVPPLEVETRVLEVTRSYTNPTGSSFKHDKTKEG